jgi:hypothetical protein
VQVEVHEPATEHVVCGVTMPYATPHCERCRVAWPCPKAAAEAGTQFDIPVTVVAPGMEILSTAVIPDTHCRGCAAPWPCATVARRGGHPHRSGHGGHGPVAVGAV